MTHAFKIGDKVRLKGGADVGFVRGTDRFTTGEPCYFVEPYLPGSGRMYVGETALEIASDDSPTESQAEQAKPQEALSSRTEAGGGASKEDMSAQRGTSAANG